MLNYSVESKSQLAKLLATENIKIEHRNAPTAAFNLETRTLICPIWNDMSGQMYDLLLGHEVSHALETPYQGWHNAVCERGKNYRHFLNVVEDARIEKKIKRRYPGIRRSFIGAYKQLLDEDFFGIGDVDVNGMFFIDRLNIHCKAGINAGVKFDIDIEKELLKLVEDAETWNDVLYATEKIWDYSKLEQKQEAPNSKQTVFEFDENGDYDLDDTLNESDYYDFDDEDEFSESDNKVNSKSEKSDEESESDESEENSDESGQQAKAESEEATQDDDKESQSKQAGKGIDGDENLRTFGEPKCKTDETFRKNESKLLSSEVTSYNYINIPKLKNTKMITKANDINEFMTKHFTDEKYNLTELYNSFKNKNEKYIGLLVKEFEMRKAAKAHSRAKISDTGDININKIYNYQFDDEIFRKSMIVPKGKSHGLVLLLDMSGSMADNISGSIEQILVLTSFCKKVNIPFEVYGFNSKTYDGEDMNNSFEQTENTLQISSFTLTEFINSKMKTTEFNTAVKNMCGLIKMYSSHRTAWIPTELRLGRTPLVESMITLQPLIKKFKTNNNLDIVNLVVVHDGDADSVVNFRSPGQYVKQITEYSTERFVLRDKAENLNYEIERDDNIGLSEQIRRSVYKWFTETTQTKIFGFFITGSSRGQMENAVSHRYVDPKKQDISFNDYPERYRYMSEKTEQLKKEKFLISKTPGYESFFLIVGGKNLQIDDDELVVTGKVNKKSLTTALRRLTKNKVTNRVLVSKFIEGIAV